MSDVSPADVRAIHNVVHDHVGVSLTDDQVRDLLTANTELVSEILQWGVYDTVTRSHILNTLALHIVGEPWPLYRDGDNGFWQRLKEACFIKGYALQDPL